MKRFWRNCAGGLQPGTPESEAMSTAETGDPRFPCNETELCYFGRALVPSPPIWFNSKLPSQHGGENPVVPVAAKTHLLFLSRASINAKLEILIRRRRCCFILPQGLHSCGSSPLNVIGVMCWHSCLGSAWTQEQDKKIGSRRQTHPCCSPVLDVNQALSVPVCDVRGLCSQLWENWVHCVCRSCVGPLLVKVGWPCPPFLQI